MTDHPVTTETGGPDLDGPMIIASMRRDPAAEVRVVPSIEGHGMSGQVASAVLAYVDGLLAEVERLRRQRQAVLDLLSGEMSGVDLVGGRMAFETVVHWRDRCVLAALGVDHV